MADALKPDPPHDSVTQPSSTESEERGETSARHGEGPRREGPHRGEADTSLGTAERRGKAPGRRTEDGAPDDRAAQSGATGPLALRPSRLLRLVPPIITGARRAVNVEEWNADDLRPVEANAPRGRRWGSLGRALDHFVFSSLTRRIIVLNLAALLVLLTGILYLNQFREGLIDARVQSLRTQGQIIASAIAASASVETDEIKIDPDVLLELEAGETARPVQTDQADLEFPINPERVAPVLRRLIVPTRTRARLYDADAALLLDSRHLYSQGQVLRYDLPEIDGGGPSPLTSLRRWFDRLWRGGYPLYREEAGGSGTIYPEVRAALENGVTATALRATEDGTLVVAVAVPIQRFRATLGVLLLSSQGQVIDQTLAAERTAIMRVFGVALLVTTLLSVLLASTVAQPLRDLSRAALRVRSGGVETREEIPDYSDREDEIGDLSASLRAMTSALYDRIDAIERFAADVSHELKNPLTSLRSAVETLPLAKTDESRARLIEIINHDVRRLNRLISDIADASRLDAELALQNADPIDLKRVLTDLVEINRQISADRDIRIDLAIAGDRRPYTMFGHDLRIGQVVTNLIENARSFVPEPGGRIRVAMRHVDDETIEIAVADNGPGVPEDARERIFERFYTDRPDGEAFGQNSGLGLSISRQIIEAHGGSLTAGDADPTRHGVDGALFRIRVPAASART